MNIYRCNLGGGKMTKLVKCHECGKELSKTAKTCSSCHSVDPFEKRIRNQMVGFFLLLGVGCFFIYEYFMYSYHFVG